MTGQSIEVIVLSEEGKVINRGRTDGKTVDTFYLRVLTNDGKQELYNHVNVFEFAAEGKIKAEMQEMAAEKKELERKHYFKRVELSTLYGARRQP